MTFDPAFSPLGTMKFTSRKTSPFQAHERVAFSLFPEPRWLRLSIWVRSLFMTPRGTASPLGSHCPFSCHSAPAPGSP